MGGATIAPTFYISSRRRSGGVVSFKCYDRIVYTDQAITVQDWLFDNNDAIEGSQLVGIIASQCGFAGWGISGSITEVPLVFIGKDKVIGRQCRDILNDISAAWCGYFKTSGDDKLIFIPFGSNYGAGNAMIHTAISEGGEKGPIEQVIMTNSTDTFISGNEGADVFSTIKINTEFASQELASAIFKRIKGYVYHAWQCLKCIIDSDISIEIDAKITFGDGSVRIANSIEKTLTPAGLLCSCGRNDVVEDEFNYTGILSREINKRIADGEKLGNNSIITRYQGIVHLADEEEKKTKAQIANTAQKRYGYSAATAEGVVKFDGAMLDGIFPTVDVNDDLSQLSLTYGNTVKKYLIKWNSDTNVSLEEVKEEKQ